MKVYKIECEWDMGFQEIYKTRQEAEKAINETDWSNVLYDEDTLEALIEDGYIKIKEIEVK